jgi:hypothetical protein
LNLVGLRGTVLLEMGRPTPREVARHARLQVSCNGRPCRDQPSRVVPFDASHSLRRHVR